MTKELFFVYGTLKSGHGNNRILADSSTLIGKAVTNDKYDLLHFGCPGAVRNEDGHPVLGEIYQVNDTQTIARLDQLEGNGSFYTRYQRPVTLVSGEEQLCWIYEIPGAGRWGGDRLCPINEEHAAYEWG